MVAHAAWNGGVRVQFPAARPDSDEGYIMSSHKMYECSCPICGKILKRQKKDINKRCKSCASRIRVGTHTHNGENNPRWKGGRRVSKSGYILVKKKDHSGAYQKEYVAEHVLVMERHLGRELSDVETVHHKNGVRSDNRIENLELWASPHTPGQRVDDIIDWVVKEYKDRVISKLSEISALEG